MNPTNEYTPKTATEIHPLHAERLVLEGKLDEIVERIRQINVKLLEVHESQLRAPCSGPVGIFGTQVTERPDITDAEKVKRLVDQIQLRIQAAVETRSVAAGFERCVRECDERIKSYRSILEDAGCV